MVHHFDSREGGLLGLPTRSCSIVAPYATPKTQVYLKAMYHTSFKGELKNILLAQLVLSMISWIRLLTRN